MKLSVGFYIKRMKQQNNRCFYCGKKLKLGYRPDGNIEIDHILPYSKYRNGTIKNLCLCCSKCNKIKSDLELWDFKLKCLNHYRYILVNGNFYFENANIKLDV